MIERSLGNNELETYVDAVFIGGVDRSGTTLLGSLLATIPGAVITPESAFKTSVTWAGAAGLPGYRTQIKNNYQFRAWGIQDLEDIEADSQAAFLETMVARYAGGPAGCWVDHTPNNLQHIRYLKSLFPGARFLHIVRDGRAVASSVMPLEWGPNTAISSAKVWLQKLAFGFAAQALFPDDVKLVYFEELVLRPVETLNSILRFLGRDITLHSERDIVIAGDIVPKGTRDQHAKVGQLPDKATIGRWKSMLTDVQVRDFQFVAGQMLTMLGYKLMDLPLDRSPSTAYCFMDSVRNTYYKKLLNVKKYNKRRGIN